MDNLVENTNDVQIEQPTAIEAQEQVVAESTPQEPIKVEANQAAPVENSSTNEAQAEANRVANEQLEAALAKLKEYHSEAKTFEVTISNKVRGGLRGFFDGYPLFMPKSHFSITSPTEEELDAAEGKSFAVGIIDIDEEKKMVVVSRKKPLEEEIWSKFKVGDKVTGKVTNTPSFGIFLDLGGVEGLIHVSRLSHARVDNPATLFSKGQDLEAVIIEIDKENNKISLSRKELIESPWSKVETSYPVGTVVNGKVKRITDFGAYVEISEGVEGLLRISEMHWTKRIASPNEVISIGKEYPVKVINIDINKQQIGLSLKRATDSPWAALKEKYAQGAEFKATVTQINDKGAVVRLENEIDAFMPKGRMRAILNGNNIPFNAGDEIEIEIAEVVSDNESMIVGPKLTEEQKLEVKEFSERPRRNEGNRGEGNKGERREKRDDGRREEREPRPRGSVLPPVVAVTGGNISFAELLSNASLDKLTK